MTGVVQVFLDIKSGFTGSLCASNPPACTLDIGYHSQNKSWLPKDDKVCKVFTFLNYYFTLILTFIFFSFAKATPSDLNS